MTGVNAYCVSGLQQNIAEHTHERMQLRSSHLKQETIEVSLPHNLQANHLMHNKVNKIEFSLCLSSGYARLRDHVIDGKKIVPGSAFLLAASMLNLKLSDSRISQLGHVTWIRPMKFESELLNITIQIDMAYNLMLRNGTTTACSLQLRLGSLPKETETRIYTDCPHHTSKRYALLPNDWGYTSLKQNLAQIDGWVEKEEPLNVSSIAITDGSLHLSAASREIRSLLLPQSMELFVYLYSSRSKGEHLAASSAEKIDQNTSFSPSNAVLWGQERSAIAIYSIFKSPQKKWKPFDTNVDISLCYETKYEAMDPTKPPDMTMDDQLAASCSRSFPEINSNIFLSGTFLDSYSCFMLYIAIFRAFRNQEKQLLVKTQSGHCVGLLAPDRRIIQHEHFVSAIIAVLRNENARKNLKLNHRSSFWNDLGVGNRFIREPDGKTVAQANVNYGTSHYAINRYETHHQKKYDFHVEQSKYSMESIIHALFECP